MSTMSREIVDRLIAGNGWLPEEPDHDAPDNPRAVRIVEYENAWGAKAYGVTFTHDRDPYRYERESEYVRNPKLIWEPPPHA